MTRTGVTRTGVTRTLSAIWREIAGIGIAPAAAYAVIVFGAVFTAAVWPGHDLSLQTSALQRTFGSIPAAERSVVASAGWSAFAGSGSLPTAADLGVQAQTLSAGIAAAGVPLAPPSASWSGITSAFVPVSTGLELEIAYRSELGRQSLLVAGRLPDRSSVTINPGVPIGVPGEAAVSAGTFQVAMTQATAARFGAGPGSVLRAQGGITLEVTAIIRPNDPGAAFWTLDPIAAQPAASSGSWLGAVFVGPDEVHDFQLAFGSPGTKLIWDFPLALAGVTAVGAGELAAHLNTAASQDIGASQVIGGSILDPGAIQVSSGLVPALTGFSRTRAAVDAILSPPLIALAVICMVAVLLAIGLVARLHAPDFALSRARGASRWQLAVRGLRSGAAGVLAAAAGLALAIAYLRDQPGGAAAPAWWLGGGTALIAVTGLPAAAVWRHRAAERRIAGTAGGPAGARRVVAEIGLTVAAAGGLAVLRQQPALSGGGLVAFTGAAPVLVAIPAVLLVVRLYPVAARGLLRVSRAARGGTGVVAMSRAVLAAPGGALAALSLVLLAGIAGFGGMVRAAVLSAQDAASWQIAGADAVITGTAVSPAAQRAIAAVPGVRHVAAVTVVPGALPSGAAVEVIAVDPASYAALTSATPWPRIPPGSLAGAAPIPAVASPAVAASLPGGPVAVRIGAAGTFRLRVTATVAGTPALPGQDTFLVLPAPAIGGAVRPGTVLVTGPGLDRNALISVVHRDLPGAAISFRSAALAALNDSPLQGSATDVYAGSVAAAAGFAIVILLLSLSLAVRVRGSEQGLARLAAMGMTRRQGRLIVLAEMVPLMLAVVAAGAAGGLVLGALAGPVLDLSVFTGGTVFTGTPVRAGLAAVAWPAAGLALLALAVMSALAWTAGRRGAAAVLRIGESRDGYRS